MSRFYGIKILKGDIAIKDVPKRWRAETQQWLDKNGTNSDTM